MANAYSVDNVVVSIEFFGTIVKDVLDALKDDKKISTAEGAKILFNTVLKTPGFIKALPMIPKEITDEITADEVKQIQQAVIDTGCIPDNAKEVAMTLLEILAKFKEVIEKWPKKQVVS